MMKIKIETRLIYRVERPHMKAPEYRSLFSRPRIKLFDDSKLQLCTGNPQFCRDIIKHVLDAHDFGPDVRDVRSAGNGQWYMTAPDLNPLENGGNAFDIEVYIDAEWPEIRKLADKREHFWSH